MKTPRNQGFTLIELLVVITIIAILASIAVPVYNGITIRANQTKALSNAKQIALACKIFAIDEDGIYPTTDTTLGFSTKYGNNTNGVAVGVTASKSTGNFQILINGGYMPSETIFHVAGDRHSGGPLVKDDGDIDTPLTLTGNGWAYVEGLSDSDNTNLPLVMTQMAGAGSAFEVTKGNPGGVWSGKAIIIRIDYGGSVEKMDTAGDVKFPDGTTSIFATAEYPTGTAFVNP